MDIASTDWLVTATYMSNWAPTNKQPTLLNSVIQNKHLFLLHITKKGFW